MVNEVKFIYGDWGMVTENKQNHDEAVDDGEPKVTYAYEDGGK